ncbi:MAG TPA: ThiF family adenylyltransferase, partial [Acetobacteraceae bacterium]|nr:ThiF family adenylyltransferase [Acetobacteraceae bacterium]
MDARREFAYLTAFDRNLGWLTEWEQLALRAKHVAIAGMGGVGGLHLLTLARLGVGGFTIADLDHFEVANFNRQVGATLRNLGRPKTEAMAEMALDINPQLRLRRFDAGVSPGQIDDFLAGADLFIDGFDFFELHIRSRVFARCAELGIPAVTAAPVGMGTGFLAFRPGGMSFERYFCLAGQPDIEQYLRFLMGVAPRGLHRGYLVDPTRVDLAGRKGPSTAMACQLCAGVTAIAALKILLGRGGVDWAPWHTHYDAYRGRLVRTQLRFGNAGPVQRLKLAVGRRMFARAARQPLTPAAAAAPLTPIEEILDLARWAPSGDNAQPWRFVLGNDETLIVRLRHQVGRNVYECRAGEPTLLSAGMLLETLRIAASVHGRTMSWRADSAERLAVSFQYAEGITPDPLHGQLTLRSVDRRRYWRRPLTTAEMTALAAALGGELLIDWHQSAAAKRHIARLNARATAIRLGIPETLPVHRRVVDWRRAHSPDGIPAAVLGLSRPTRTLMRWGLESWGRTRLLNRLGARAFAAIEVDYLPGLACGAAFVARWPAEPPAADAVEPWLRAGAALQRFWLTATQLGLSLQPNFATLAFAWYGERGTAFTTEPGEQTAAVRLSEAFRRECGVPASRVAFLGRIGEARPRLPLHRSVRLPLAALIETGDPSPYPLPQGEGGLPLSPPSPCG